MKRFQAIFMKPCNVVDYRYGKNSSSILGLILLKMANWQPFWISAVICYIGVWLSVVFSRGMRSSGGLVVTYNSSDVLVNWI